MRFLNTATSFGLTSGVITTLGLMVGLHSGTHSMAAVLGGILTIAIADSLSDALGIHISKESEANATEKEVWQATIATFATKMAMSLSFIVPILLMDLQQAIFVSILWGLSVIAVLSYLLAKQANNNPVYVVAEHLAITIVVIITTHFIGEWVAETFT